MKTRYKKRTSRWMRGGHWLPPPGETLPADQEDIAAWFAAAPGPVGMVLQILLPAELPLAKRAQWLWHAGHIWRTIVRADADVRNWTERCLLDWLDAWPLGEPEPRMKPTPPVLPIVDGDDLGIEEMYSIEMEAHIADLPEPLERLLAGWLSREQTITAVDLPFEPPIRAQLLRAGERMQFRTLLRENAEARDWWAAHGKDWLERKPTTE